MKLLAIDGNSIFNRAFYGIRPLNAPDGTPTNAIYGFLSMLDKMTKELEPDYIAVAFDVHQPTFRHEAYADYKAGRHSAPEEFHIQMPIMQNLLNDLNIPVITRPGFEADDILGTLSQMCKNEGIECCLYTGDKDSFQLVDDNVKVYLPKTTKDGTKTFIYDKAQIAAEFKGLTPHQMIDLKALQGDNSDNIPGVRGIGPKTALDLVSKFGSIEAMYDKFSSLGNDAKTISKTCGISEGVATKLIDGKEDAEFSKFLGTIKTDIPFDFKVEDLYMENFDPVLLYSDLSELGLTHFIRAWNLEPDEVEL